MAYSHIPVMLNEVLEYLNPQPGEKFIDGTLGGAGYTLALAQAVGKDGLVVGVDLDKLAINNAKAIIKEQKISNIVLVNENFKNLQQVIETADQENGSFDGLVLDLGLSSAQLEDRSRGFSFKSDDPLDMAFGEAVENSTLEIVNRGRETELIRILQEYGEERFARRIVSKIIEARTKNLITTTGELVEIIRSAVPNVYLNDKRIHFATRTFQALRIATNDELVSLETVLPQALSVLKPGGRIVVVSFHSLEDRIVKNYFRLENKDCICPTSYPTCLCQHKARLKILTKHVIEATDEEVASNPRARSAKLRAAQLI